MVGNDWLKKNKLINFLLGKELFETDASTSLAKNHSSSFSGYVSDRWMTMVNTADLFTPDISDDDLKQKVYECVSFCAPGPHALVLVVDAKGFNAENRQRMELIVNTFSDQAFQHSVVFTQKYETKNNNEIENLTAFCRGRMYQHPHLVSHCYRKYDQKSAIQAIEDMISENECSYITCAPIKAEEHLTDEDGKKRSRQMDKNIKERKALSQTNLGESGKRFN